MASDKNSVEYYYLHGFASGPKSQKAKYFQRRFKILDIDLIIPDLNIPSFEKLDFHAMVDYMNDQIKNSRSKNIVILGASLGALVALQLAHMNKNVKKLVLFAPAISFYEKLPDIVGKENFSKWEEEGILKVYHHQFKKELPIHFAFIESLKDFDPYNLNINIPVQIYHGAFDSVIPFEKVEIFAKSLPKGEFHLLETDHQMLNKLDWMWKFIYNFLELEEKENEEK